VNDWQLPKESRCPHFANTIECALSEATIRRRSNHDIVNVAIDMRGVYRIESKHCMLSVDFSAKT
jgi:hypothetical protein